jgi:hypothetical protein
MKIPVISILAVMVIAIYLIKNDKTVKEQNRISMWNQIKVSRDASGIPSNIWTDTTRLSIENPMEFLEWVTDGYEYVGYSDRIKLKIFRDRISKKIYTIRTLYNLFVYEKNECWWNELINKK